MFLTVHAATGAAIGMIVPSVPAAFALGMVSHFLLDRVPHYDPPIISGTIRDGVFKHPVMRRFVAISVCDLVAACALTAILRASVRPVNSWAFASGAFGGILPDLMFGLYRLTNNRWLGIYNRWHEANHFDPKKLPVTFISGMIPQLIALGLALVFMKPSPG